MNFVKSRFSLAISLTIICWAVLCFKPVWAEDTLGSGDVAEDLDISGTGDGDYSELSVLAGGTLKTAIVRDDGVLTVDGGTLTVNDSGTRNQVINNGTLEVVSGEAERVYLGEGGQINVSGGTLSSVNGELGNIYATGGTISSVNMQGGSLTFESGAQANNVIVDNGGSVVVNNAELTSAAGDYNEISTNSSLDVSAAGSVNNVIIADSNATIREGGQANNVIVQGETSIEVEDAYLSTVTVERDGILSIESSGTSEISDILVDDGGKIQSVGDGVVINNVFINNDGAYSFSTNDSVDSFSITNASLGDFSGSIKDNTAEGLLINNGSSLDVVTDGKADNVTVSAGGKLNVFNGGLATNITAEGEAGNSAQINISQNSSNGEVDGLTMGNYSELNIGIGGVANEVIANGANTINVNGGNLVNSFVAYGIVNVNSGSVDAVSFDNAKLNVSDGATAKNVSILQGSSAVVEGLLTKNTAGVYSSVRDTASLTIQNNGVAEYLNIQGGKISVLSDGSLNFSNVLGDAEIVVDSNTSINNLIVNNGGNLSIEDTADATDTYVNIEVLDGGKIQSASGKSVSISELLVNDGGSFNFTTNDTIDAFHVEKADLTVQEGSITDNKASDVLITTGSSLIVKDTGSAENLTVNTGGTLVVETPDTAGKISVDGLSINGGKLITNTGSLVNNVTATNGASATLAANTLSGNLTLDSSATGFVSSELFVQDTKLNDLRFVNGQNLAFGDIVNTDDTNNHNLFLENGTYNTTISGWNNLTLSSSSLAVSSDLELKEGGVVTLDKYSSLFVGTTEENGYTATIKGDLVNSGKINLTTKNSNAGESLIIDGNYTGVGDARLDVNVDVESAVSDKIIITGQANGSTQVYLSTKNDVMQRNKILFAEAQSQGTNPGEGVFKIWRKEGSVYEWDTIYGAGKWYAQIKKASGDNGIIVVPEMAAYYGLIDNTFMQTSSLGANLRSNIALSEYKKVPCRDVKRGSNTICRSNRPLFSGWFAPASSSITVESPFIYDAEINGFDGGLDLISNGNTKLGLLASYRQGLYNYEESGQGYQINGEAETDITSYLAGAYLRHDGQNWSTILAGYAGVLDADISTDDDVNTSTSGSTYGATLDVSYIYKNINGLRIEPGVRISYTAVELDPTEDNGGKTQEFDNASRTEIEAGIRFAKRWEFPDSRAEIFVKPSIVKIMDDTSDFILDEESSLSAAEDRTVAKVSAGISFDMTSTLSASLAGSYSVGDDYTNTSGNLSVMYKF